MIVLLANTSNSQRLYTVLPQAGLPSRTLLLTSTDGWHAALRQPALPIQVLSLTSALEPRSSLGLDFLGVLHSLSGVPVGSSRFGTVLNVQVGEALELSPRAQAYLAQTGGLVDGPALLQFEQAQANATGACSMQRRSRSRPETD